MNNMESLADFMFEEMERLNEIDITEDDASMKLLEAEIKRAKAMGTTAQAIVAAGRATLDVKRFTADYVGIKADTSMPKMLEG